MPSPTLLVLGLSALLGVGVGFSWRGGGARNAAPQEATQSTSQGADSAGGKALSGLAAILDAPDEETRVAQFLGALRTTDVAALLRLLRYVSAPGTLSPQAEKLYLEAIVDRLLELGAAEEVLAIRGLRGNDYDDLVGTVVRSLARRDPGAAEKLVLAQEGRERDIALAALAVAFGAIDPERGLALVEQDKSGSAAYLFFGEWAKHDPEAATQEALKFSQTPGGSEYHIGIALAEWARSDRDAAWQWMRKLPSDKRYAANSGFIGALAESEDLAEAVDFLYQHADLRDRSSLKSIGQRLAQSPEKIGPLLDRLPPGNLRNGLIEGIADSFSGDAEAALRWADTLLPAERATAMAKMVEDFSRKDPEQALTLALGETNATARENCLAAAMKGWGAQDFPGALAAVTQRLEGPAQLAALTALFSADSYNSDLTVPEKLRLLPRSLTEEDRFAVLSKMGQSWRDFDVAMPTLEGLPDRDRAALAGGLLSRGWGASREQILALVDMIPPERRGESIWMVNEKIAPTDPRTAAEVVASIPDSAHSPQKTQNLQSIIDTWAAIEPSAARRFVGTLPPGEGKEQAIKALAGSLLAFDLETATQVAAGATQAAIRKNLVRRLAEEWAQVDPERGRAVMAAFAKDSEEREILRKLLPQQ